MMTPLEMAKGLWDRLSVDERIEFVKYLASDTNVELFTQAQVDEKVAAALKRATKYPSVAAFLKASQQSGSKL